MLDGTGYTALPKEREDFVEERALAEDTGDALEPVPLAEKGIDDVDLNRGIVPKVGDGAGRADIGEDEMIVIPYGGRALGGQVRRSVWADGRDEAKSLTLDQALHLKVEHAHVRCSLFSRAPSNLTHDGPAQARREFFPRQLQSLVGRHCSPLRVIGTDTAH